MRNPGESRGTELYDSNRKVVCVCDILVYPKEYSYNSFEEEELLCPKTIVLQLYQQVQFFGTL